ncbi:MAG: OmpA family protein [Xanthomonadales bacterium]|nr:OmpA family protein [Xanthomonadales bacterium]
MRSAWVIVAGVVALGLWSLLIHRWLAESPSAKHRVGSAAPSASLGFSVQRLPVAALELRRVDGGLLLSGEVPSAASAAELLSKTQVTYAPMPVQDGLRVRPEVGQVDWLGSALTVMPLPMPGIEQPEWLVSAEGLRIGGVAADAAAHRTLRELIAQRFPGWSVQDGVQTTPPIPSPRSDGESAQRLASPANDAAPPTMQSPRLVHPRQAEVDALLAARPVVFASGSTRLRREGGPDWRALARILRETDGVVHVRGHTDDRGDPAANRRLSARRAESVKQALQSAGVPADRLRVEGVGADEPRVGNDTAEGRRQNRRIELRLEVEA